ncbi:hypothetical protein FOCC_FOCC005563, partial [Frankliniella occidentalis]
MEATDAAPVATCRSRRAAAGGARARVCECVCVFVFVRVLRASCHLHPTVCTPRKKMERCRTDGFPSCAAGRRGAGLAVRPLHRQRRRPDADAALAHPPRAPGGGARDPEPAGVAGPAAAPAAQPQPPALRRRQRGPPARPRAPAPAPGRVRAAVPPRRLPVPGGDGQPAAPRRRQGRRLQHHGQRPDRHRPERRHHDVHQPQQAREWAAARAREAAVVRRLRGPRRRGHHGRGAPPVPEAGGPRRARPGRRHLHHHRLPGRQRGA